MYKRQVYNVTISNAFGDFLFRMTVGSAGKSYSRPVKEYTHNDNDELLRHRTIHEEYFSAYNVSLSKASGDFLVCMALDSTGKDH